MKSIFIVIALLLAFPATATAKTPKTEVPQKVAVGKITAVVGKSHIIHAGGARVAAAVDAPVYQGDVIETTKTGAVNILFTDNTAFAVSENARLSVDKFIYDSSKDTNTSLFSVMRGLFVYTSGLIGKKDPSKVRIETTVASLGIRGTVIAGHIYAAGHPSIITLLDGAITVTNGSGTYDMNDKFDTVSVDSYQDTPKDQGEIKPEAFAKDYHSLTAVAQDTLDDFIDIEDEPKDGAGDGSENAPQDPGETDRIDVPEIFDRPELPEDIPEDIPEPSPELDIEPHGQ